MSLRVGNCSRSPVERKIPPNTLRLRLPAVLQLESQEASQGFYWINSESEMNQIATTSTYPQLSPQDRLELADARSSLTDGMLERPLSEPMRQRCVAFMRSSDVQIQPASRPEIEAEIAGLMMAFHSARNVSKAEAAIVTRKYAEALERYPLWAIKQGFRMVERGEVAGLNPDFPPSAPRLCEVVSACLLPHMADRVAVREVLKAMPAPRENPEMQRKIIETIRGVKSFGEHIGLGSALPVNEQFARDLAAKRSSAA